MDNGAHYFRSDFQVHTPRDINWKSHRAVTDDERRQYAHDFVAACRQKKIQAVAITDHHDLAFCLCLAGDGNRSKELGLYNFLGYDITHAWPTSARDRRATNATS